MQERLEASRGGRTAISVFVVITIVSVLIWNLPSSALRKEGIKLAGPYIRAAGLDQNWGVFSPDPRRHSLELVALVQYADGTEHTFSVPRGGRLVGSYWDYRWQKWAEWTSTDSHEPLWGPAAAWFARKARAEGGHPVRVTLVRRWRATLPPGPGPSRGDWHEYAYYTYDVPGPIGGASQ